ncbi:MAG: tRNA (N6-threonylcarbamoyladenosine(37)-N6)-methyltransferase TrmO [Bdellovibrionales bacterium]
MNTVDNTVNLSPIGIFQCISKYPAEVPRQPNWAQNEGRIELYPEFADPQMLQGLQEFSHIWVIFVFNRNSKWKVMTDPPYKGAPKVGTWGSRGPYRPNPLGLSCLQIEKIKGRHILVRNHDILNGTPIVDIKPYVTQSDSHPEARNGWLEKYNRQIWPIHFSNKALEKAHWVQQWAEIDIFGFIYTQLGHDPTDLQKTNSGTGNSNL